MTFKEIDEEFDIAPIWMNYIVSNIEFNIRYKCNMRYYNLTDFNTTIVSCSSGWLLKCEDWKLVMKRFKQ